MTTLLLFLIPAYLERNFFNVVVLYRLLPFSKETVILEGMYDVCLLVCQFFDSFRLNKLNETSVDAYYGLDACCFFVLGVMEHVPVGMSFHED